MMKVDVYGDVYDDGEPDDADWFNGWLDAQEIKRREETINTIKNSWLGYNAEYYKKVEESKK